MAAPTATFTAGAAAIAATGEANGLLLTVDSGLLNPRVAFGFSGTFTSCVVAVRGRKTGLTQFYPVRAVNPNGSAVIGDSTSITLTDSTNQVIEVDASGCDQLEVWVVSGTPTALTVEERQTASASPLLNVINQSVAGQQTFTGAVTINVASATALVVGPNGTTNPTLAVVTNVGSAATGISVTGRAAGAGVTLATLSSGADEDLLVAPKGAGGVKVTSTSANALAVGPSGSTNPVLKVNANTGSAATGVSVTGAAAGSGVAVAAISSGTDESFTLNAKGAGLVNLAGISTGLVVIGRGTLKTPVLGLTKTDVNSQNAAPTIAQWLGGYLTHNSQTGAGTLTTPTGANISGGISGVATGDSFVVYYQNRGNQTVTLTAGDGNVTLKGTVAVPTLKTATLLFSCTGANTWDVTQVLSA